MEAKAQSVIVVPLVVGVLTGVFAVLGHIVVSAFEIPVRLQLPPAVRAVGVGVIVLGAVFLGWLFRCWSPIDILQSTYETMRRAGRRELPHEAPARTDLLIVRGPQRHVRHPLYFAVVVLFLGWWLLLDYTMLLLMALLFFLWFTLVVIRFEEEELSARFGEAHEAYVRSVPMIIPSLRPRWR